MADIATDYAERVGESARLANLTSDAMIQTELLKLRQTYLAAPPTLGLSPHKALARSSAAEKKAKPQSVSSTIRAASSQSITICPAAPGSIQIASSIRDSRALKLSSSNMSCRGVTTMRMPKPVKSNKLTLAISNDTHDRATVKRMLAAMEAFMAADAATDQIILTQRAA